MTKEQPPVHKGAHQGNLPPLPEPALGGNQELAKRIVPTAKFPDLAKAVREYPDDPSVKVRNPDPNPNSS